MLNSTKPRFASILSSLGILGLLGSSLPKNSGVYQPKEIKSRYRNNHAQKRLAFNLRVARNRRRNKEARLSRTLNRA